MIPTYLLTTISFLSSLHQSKMIAVSNSYDEECGTLDSSEFGCGPNLNCVVLDNSLASTCQPNQLLKSTLEKGEKCTDISECPLGTKCQTKNEENSNCELCKAALSLCNDKDSDCCDGSTCTEVNGIVKGKDKLIYICLPKEPLLFKRIVSSTNYYCVSGCCAYSQTECATLGSPEISADGMITKTGSGKGGILI